MLSVRNCLNIFISLSLFLSTTAAYAQADSMSISPSVDSIENVPHITLPDYFVLLKDNLVQQSISPFTQTKEEWIRTGIFAATTVGLAFLDKPVQKAVTGFSEPGNNFYAINSAISDFGEIPLIVSVAGLGAYGYFFKDEKLKNTALLASQAYITSTVFTTLIKFATGRERPEIVDENGKATGRFLGPLQAIKYDNGSFPSRHTAVAFATATVFATAYHDSPWVPAVSYSAASLIGLSRINTNEHWLTDVFVGAALGYVSGRQVMKRYRIFQTEKSAKKGYFTWSAAYGAGKYSIGMRYVFR